ncbi:hypothetical protein [Leptolyngbya iicbica]
MYLNIATMGLSDRKRMRQFTFRMTTREHQEMMELGLTELRDAVPISLSS